jgi:hypothetical protein
MPVLTKGSFALNLGIVRVSGELSEVDRQCAWELYAELSTRVAVTGKQRDPDCENFENELYVESFDSLYHFFTAAREIMKKFPVGKVGTNSNHLGVIISDAMSNVMRPFLEKWQVPYRHWWENQSNPRRPPLERQNEYPDLSEMLADWAALRWLMRQLQSDLVSIYRLRDLNT